MIATDAALAEELSQFVYDEARLIDEKRFDEWYDFQTNPASNPLVHVLMTVDESTYTGGMMGAVGYFKPSR